MTAETVFQSCQPRPDVLQRAQQVRIEPDIIGGGLS